MIMHTNTQTNTHFTKEMKWKIVSHSIYILCCLFSVCNHSVNEHRTVLVVTFCSEHMHTSQRIPLNCFFLFIFDKFAVDCELIWALWCHQTIGVALPNTTEMCWKYVFYSRFGMKSDTFSIEHFVINSIDICRRHDRFILPFQNSFYWQKISRITN